MRVSRLVLTCLLGFGVTLQGYAGVAVMDASCPMQRSATSAGMNDMPGSMPAQQHCHTDLTPAAQGGGHCHHGIGCQSASPASVSVHFQPVFQPVMLPAPPLAEPGFQSLASPLLWRPPALI